MSIRRPVCGIFAVGRVATSRWSNYLNKIPMSMIDSADQLRNAANAGAADPRMRHQSLEQRIDYIAQFMLSDLVPEEVQIHFETGKNLFVYAWHVYRFHMVAEQHVLGTLEMAVRLRLTALPGFTPPRGLSALLLAARTKNLIANDRFSTRHQWAFERARWRYDIAEMERMVREEIDECLVDHSNVVPTDEDLSYDWLEHFIGALPKLRNMHAHGSSALDPTIGRTFEIVVELINQLFEQCSAKDKTSNHLCV
jgi:hypothetical protein